VGTSVFWLLNLHKELKRYIKTCEAIGLVSKLVNFFKNPNFHGQGTT